jgi:cytochrome c oxidase assembly factor CtaG
MSGLLAHLGPAGLLPELTEVTALTMWEFQFIPTLAVLLTAALYLAGLWKLRQRGDRWPPGRTFAFLAGMGTLIIATQSSLGVYDTTLLWVHMVQHMILVMLAPLLMALGAPITLALRTLPGRPRAVLLKVLHSPVVGVLTFPLVAGLLYIVNPWVLYFSPLYEATLRNPVLHDINHLHFVLIGCLWFWTLLGIDPLPHRPSYPARLIAIFISIPFHAFLGVTIMGATTIIAGDYYLALDRGWGPAPLQDQQIAGSLLWASGDLVSFALLLVLCVQWAKASEREARATDRRLDLAEAKAARSARLAAAPPATAAAAPEP